ncbi:hypothetical protein Tco_0123707 [Tanacetum coccineum]
MGDDNHIRTLGDYSKPSHEGYRNTIELPVGNNMIPLQSDTIRTAKLRNDILMFQQHHGESLSVAWTHFKDLLQTVPHHGIDLWLKVQIFYVHVNPVTRRTIDQSAGSKLRDLNVEESWALLEELALYDNKSLKLGTHPVSSARSYPTIDLQCLTHIHRSINAITIHPKHPEESQDNEPDVGHEEKGNLENINSNPHPDPLASIAIEQVQKLNSMLESLGLVPQSANTKFVYTKEDDGEVMFIEIIRDDDEPQNESPNEGEGTTTEGPKVEYFDMFPTRDELTYHKKLNPREDANGGIGNFTGRIKGMHVFIGNFTYVVDFMIVEDISSIIDPRFTNRDDDVAYKIPYKIEQYNSLSNLEKEHTKSIYLRNDEDKRSEVNYVMSKILGFYKECLELGPAYVTGLDGEGEVTLYLMRRNLEALRKFHWMILGGRFNQLLHVSSPLLSKPGEY